MDQLTMMRLECDMVRAENMRLRKEIDKLTFERNAYFSEVGRIKKLIEEMGGVHASRAWWAHKLREVSEGPGAFPSAQT